MHISPSAERPQRTKPGTAVKGKASGSPAKPARSRRRTVSPRKQVDAPPVDAPTVAPTVAPDVHCADMFPVLRRGQLHFNRPRFGLTQAPPNSPFHRPPAPSPKTPAVTPPRTPNVCASAAAAVAAVAAVVYESPLTGETQPAQERRRTRGSDTAAKVSLEERLAALKPRGRVQRAVKLSDDERHELDMEKQRQRRAHTKALQDATQPLMVDLARTLSGCRLLAYVALRGLWPHLHTLARDGPTLTLTPTLSSPPPPAAEWDGSRAGLHRSSHLHVGGGGRLARESEYARGLGHRATHRSDQRAGYTSPRSSFTHAGRGTACCSYAAPQTQRSSAKASTWRRTSTG